MKRKTFFPPLFLFPLFIIPSACKYYSYGLEEFFYRENTLDKRIDTLTELNETQIPQNLPDEYTVLVITDIHFGGENREKNGARKDGTFLKKIQALSESEKPEFCICLGDVAEHGLDSEFRDFVSDIVKPLEEMGIKTYNVIGNHDLYNSGWASYQKHLNPGTSFYHFKTQNFSWYFLDSASCSLGNSQLTKLRRKMESDDAPKLVFMHVPLYADGLFYFTMQNSAERNQIISVFNKHNIKAVVDGHTHIQSVSNLGNFNEYTMAGYLEKRAYTLIRINERTATVKCAYYLYD